MAVGLYTLGTGKSLAADAHGGRGGVSRYPNENKLDAAKRIFKKYSSPETAARASLDRDGMSHREPVGWSIDEEGLARSLIQQLELTVKEAKEIDPWIVTESQLVDAVIGELQSPEHYHKEAIEKLGTLGFESHDDCEIYFSVNASGSDSEAEKLIGMTLSELDEIYGLVLDITRQEPTTLVSQVMQSRSHLIERMRASLPERPSCLENPRSGSEFYLLFTESMFSSSHEVGVVEISQLMIRLLEVDAETLRGLLNPFNATYSSEDGQLYSMMQDLTNEIWSIKQEDN